MQDKQENLFLECLTKALSHCTNLDPHNPEGKQLLSQSFHAIRSKLKPLGERTPLTNLESVPWERWKSLHREIPNAGQGIPTNFSDCPDSRASYHWIPASYVVGRVTGLALTHTGRPGPVQSVIKRDIGCCCPCFPLCCGDI